MLNVGWHKYSLPGSQLACTRYIIVGGSSKIQTLCHTTQVQLKLRFTTMERLTGYQSCFSSPKKVQVYY